MGVGRFSSDDWGTYAKRTYAGKTTKEVFKSRKIDPDFDPKNIVVRESRDSVDNPFSTPIIVGLDVTGSMHYIIDQMARTGLGKMCSEIYDRKPVTDPHVMCLGIGDVTMGDQAPLQATQFEADIRIQEQIDRIWLEGHGGGNDFESYDLPWYFAAMKTEIDCFEKRGKKGYLFTVGDEYPPNALTEDHFTKVFGPGQYPKLTSKEMLQMAQRKYHVFHIIAEEGNCARREGRKVEKAWRRILGQNVIPLSDHTKMAETIVSTLQIMDGVDHRTVADSWDGSTGLVVAEATRTLQQANVEEGIVTL